MLPYLFIFFLASILFFRAYRKVDFLIYFFVFVSIMMAGLRDMIGGFDVYIYAEVYEVLRGKYLFIYNPFEKGFLVYYYILQYIETSREFLFFATALVMTLLHFYTIKKLSPNVGMSLFIYFCKFFLFSFVYIRQGLAMGILWLCLSFLIQRKYWYVLPFIVLTFFFHIFSIAFAPFLLAAHWKFKQEQLALIAFTILFISVTPLGIFLTSFVAESADSEKLSIYTNKSGGINFFYLIEGGLGILLSILFQKYFYKNQRETVIFNGFFMYSVMILAGLTNATFIRFSWYYFIFVVIALPYIYYYYKLENIQFKSIFKILLFLYYSLVFFRLLIVYDGGDFMPYKTIFQDFERNGKWEFMEYRQRHRIPND